MSSPHSDWHDSLPLDAHQKREVFARFGLAMYYAQCLEQQLGLMLASMYNRQFFEVIPEARDAFFDRELSKTLGRMVKALKKNTIEIPSTLEERLTEALKIRNGLAHGYFYKRSAAILSLQGRENMISELQERVDFFQALDNDFTEIMVEWITVLMTGCLCAGDNDCVAISARDSDHPGVASVSGAATQFVLSLTALLSVASLGASMRRGVGPRKEHSHSGRRFAPRWR